MGPLHGDELNLISKGANYGWPLVSEGNHYNGKHIPSHSTNDKFTPPVRFWVPTIAPFIIGVYADRRRQKMVRKCIYIRVKE